MSIFSLLIIYFSCRHPSIFSWPRFLIFLLYFFPLFIFASAAFLEVSLPISTSSFIIIFAISNYAIHIFLIFFVFLTLDPMRIF
jgi:hypothetical protein